MTYVIIRFSVFPNADCQFRRMTMKPRQNIIPIYIIFVNVVPEFLHARLAREGFTVNGLWKFDDRTSVLKQLYVSKY